MHVIIVDNGRSRQLGNPNFRNSLKCIRCGACFNTCPVYRKSGGHSYHSAIAGPIGVILNPNLNLQQNADLPFASTLCGSCSNVCPVKIDIHEQIWKWRQVVTKEGYVTSRKKIGINLMSFILSHPFLYRAGGKIGRYVMRFFPFLVANKSLNPWYKQREMPKAPKETFRDWYIKNKK
jgi:L-lactate dehydrogenase complex protein LldF